MRLSVIIPARNEAGAIGNTVRDVRSALSAAAIPYEILIVDDGSTDGTAGDADAWCARDPCIRLVRNDPPHGFGRAVRRGLDAARGDAVAITMADGSDDPGDLVRYYRVLRDRAECAFGSRFMASSRLTKYPPVKLMLNRAGNRAIRWLFGIQYDDVTNAFKAYRVDVIDRCRPLRSSGFELTAELSLKAIVRGCSYEVVPTNWRGRAFGVSHFRLYSVAARYLMVVLRVWLETFRRRTAGT